MSDQNLNFADVSDNSEAGQHDVSFFVVSFVTRVCLYIGSLTSERITCTGLLPRLLDCVYAFHVAS